MPPQLALVLTIGFCSVMLWRERRSHPELPAALWLPVVWIFIIGSRFLSQWLMLLGVMSTGEAAMEDGSPLDAAFFLVLILAGIAVLARRRIALSELARNNVALTIFFVYCFLAIGWSDFPVVAFKRWIKALGHPVMALVVLTEGDRIAAFKSVLARCAYLHAPLSILFIKYYPEYGRGFDSWTGEGYNRGINLNKNELGYVCMVFGLFFIWNLLSLSRQALPKALKRQEFVVAAGFLGMIGWLLSISSSATSLACTVLAFAVMLAMRSPLVDKRFLGTYFVVTLLLLTAGELTVGIYANVVEMLGRDPTLTDRTKVWSDLFTIEINPVLGAGFESFWLGWRLDQIWAKWWWHPNQAHNGYIETYLNLGWLGLLLLAGTFLATFRKSQADLLRNPDFGGFRMGALLAILAYNYTEATFKGVHLVWTLFHLIALDYPASETAQGAALPASVSSSAASAASVAARPVRRRWNPDFRIRRVQDRGRAPQVSTARRPSATPFSE